jgi:hypothetical protein
VNVYGDASGKSGSTKSKQSDYDIIRNRLGSRYVRFAVHVPAANPPVAARINAVNARLRSASGDVRYHVHPRCQTLATSWSRTSYKPGTRDIHKPSGETLTHASDGEGYRLYALYPVRVDSRPYVSTPSRYFDPVLGRSN